MSRVFDIVVANPKDQGGWGVWLAAHFLDHLQITLAARSMSASAQIPLFDLGLWRPELASWAGDHQAMHDAINNIIGGSSPDMTQIDWNNEESWSAFLSYNALDHQKFWTSLGIM